jgi:hypothetical protein
VFDDPVSSLDFEWRNNVAKRLVLESKQRQVIVFTHDVVFLLALKQYAEESCIGQLDQHVRRQSKGVCADELPWVAMPVKGKIGYLKNRFQAAEKFSRDGNHDAYEYEAKYLYGAKPGSALWKKFYWAGLWSGTGPAFRRIGWPRFPTLRTRTAKRLKLR